MTAPEPILAAVPDQALEDLLEALFAHYHQDFRGYARASLKRRVAHSMPRYGCATMESLQARLLKQPDTFSDFLRFITVQVSQMFRNPSYFRALREVVLPVLATYPSLKIWVAGCSTGEEAYSLAILLREEALLERSIIYATDISTPSLERAQDGVYGIDRLAEFTVNYQQTAPRANLADYYLARYGSVTFDRSLKGHIVFSDHSLATDNVFSEVQLISCRNVLIYFDMPLQNRAVRLFKESLCRSGFLGLGARENLRFVSEGDAFREFVREDRIYQRC
jgi:chemotaxis protein methyltransferase CheR